jgi:hypothetical protein
MIPILSRIQNPHLSPAHTSTIHSDKTCGVRIPVKDKHREDISYPRINSDTYRMNVWSREDRFGEYNIIRITHHTSTKHKLEPDTYKHVKHITEPEIPITFHQPDKTYTPQPSTPIKHAGSELLIRWE